MSIPGLLFVLAFAALMGLALFRHPLFGLYAYVAVFYLHPPSRWWGALLPDLRWSLLAAAVTLAAILLRRPAATLPAWHSTTPARIMLVFTAWFWIGGLWALDQDQHFPAAVMLTKYIVVFYLIYRLVDTPSKIYGFLLSHVAGCLYLGWLGTTSGGSGRLDGVGGPGIDDSNTLGMHLSTGVVIAAALMLRVKGWRWALCVASTGLALNTMVLAGSRGAFVGLAAGGLALTFLRPVMYKKKFVVYAVLGCLAIGIIASEQFWERMDTVVVAVDRPEERDDSAESRIVMARAQLLMAGSHLLGAGHRGSEVLSPIFLERKWLTAAGARSSHNVFLTVLVEQGIPGVVLFFLLVGWTARTIALVARRGRLFDKADESVQVAAVGGALACVLAAGLFADFSKCEVQIWLFALLASLGAISSPSKGTVASTATELPDGAAIAGLKERTTFSGSRLRSPP